VSIADVDTVALCARQQLCTTCMMGGWAVDARFLYGREYRCRAHTARGAVPIGWLTQPELDRLAAWAAAVDATEEPAQ
jgi:hypothetical protein